MKQHKNTVYFLKEKKKRKGMVLFLPPLGPTRATFER
jgi:hypothetical protein